MKTFSALLAAQYALGCTTLATALKIVRADGVTFGFTSHDVDDPVGGVTYKSKPGLDSTTIVTNATLAVSNLEIKALHDGTIFTTKDMLSGVWRNAAFSIFRYNYLGLTDGIDTLLAGTLGELGLQLNIVTAELRSLAQYLQQPIGSASSRDCRYRLGSTVKYQGGLCTKNISAPPFSMPATVSSVTSNRVFRDSARAEAVDYFGAGEVHWLTGNNAGLFHLISQYAADGTFTLAGSMFSTVQIGDTFTAIVGCRKRANEDCTIKFNNRLNFGGEDLRQGFNDLMKRIIPSV